MGLEPLNWRHFRYNLPSVTSDTETIINSVYNAFKATKYSDNSTRTPGAGVAWTSTIAANGTRIFTPPSPTKTFSVQMDRYRAGITSSQSTAFGHVLANGVPMISYTLDGTYSATNVASPVSSGGRWFGWTYFWSLSVLYVRSIDVFESQDALIICPIRSDGTCHPIVIGGFIDPQITSQNSLGYSAETDGKIYGLCNSGDPGSAFNAGYINRAFLTTPKSFLGSDSDGNYTQAAIMAPRTSTLLNIKKLLTVDLSKVPSGTSCSIDTGFGTVAKIPMFACSSKRFIGRYREFYFYKRARSCQTVYENGQAIGYTVGYYAYELGSNDTILITR
jgi:hypothetical protein